jgi:uncharacterized membrane protein YhaH (DUF805 family)
MDFNYLFTSLDGRINRAKWWAGIVILIVINIIVALIIGVIFKDSMAGRIVAFIIALVLLYPGYALNAKRFQDRNKPAMFALVGAALGIVVSLISLFSPAGNPMMMGGALGAIIGIIAIAIGIWYLIELGILKGTSGPNQYGADPLGGAAAK